MTRKIFKTIKKEFHKMTEQEKREKNKKNQKHVSTYIKNNYDDIKVRVPKGDKDRIKELAKESGFDSVNSFIIAAIESYGKK